MKYSKRCIRIAIFTDVMCLFYIRNTDDYIDVFIFIDKWEILPLGRFIGMHFKSMCHCKALFQDYTIVLYDTNTENDN